MMESDSSLAVRSSKAITRYLPYTVKNYIRKNILHTGQRKIRAYLESDPQSSKRVIFGGHWSDHEGWLVLNEFDQDITKRLQFPDASVDCVFTEHVLEHIPFVSAIDFIAESYRILRPGGILRIVCPGFERIMNFNFSDGNPLNSAYFEKLIVGASPEKDARLREIGLKGLSEDPRLFFVNNLFTMHGHRFIWSQDLMKKVMEAVGFTSARGEKPGTGRVREYCIERKRRGVYLGKNWKEDAAGEPHFDAESIVVEAIK
jgi:SAM-dependent methyltransferase